MKQPLWYVRLKRDKQTVREHVVAPDAESAIECAKKENPGYVVIERMEREFEFLNAEEVQFV